MLKWKPRSQKKSPISWLMAVVCIYWLTLMVQNTGEWSTASSVKKRCFLLVYIPMFHWPTRAKNAAKPGKFSPLGAIRVRQRKRKKSPSKWLWKTLSKLLLASGIRLKPIAGHYAIVMKSSIPLRKTFFPTLASARLPKSSQWSYWKHCVKWKNAELWRKCARSASVVVRCFAMQLSLVGPNTTQPPILPVL